MNLGCSLLFITVPLTFWGWVLVHYINKLRAQKKPFNYRITDLWMALVCLSPACYMLGAALKSHKAYEFFVVGALAFAGTLGGLVVGRIHIELPPHSGARNAAESAVSILTGALLGWAFFPVPLVIPTLTFLLILDVK